MRRAEGASDARRLRGKRGVGVATAHAQRVKGAVGVASVRVGGVGVATAHKQRVKGRVGVASARVGDWVWPLRMRSAGRREEAAKASLAGAI